MLGAAVGELRQSRERSGGNSLKRSSDVAPTEEEEEEEE